MTFEPKRILCAVDLREPSRQIIEWSRQMAQGYGATVELVYVDWWEAPRYFTPGQIASLTAQVEANRQTLMGRLNELGSAIGAPHEMNILQGDPGAAILERAAASGAGLVIMGSHGRTGFSRLRLGSVAEDVAREARCPVLVVRHAPRGNRDEPRNVICPVNFTALARKTLEAAASVAAALRARLWVVYSAEERSEAHGKREELCAWIPDELRGKCQLTEVVREGNAAEQIVLLAREKDADLIVLGAERQPFLEFTTIGSTTERVIRHSASSVLMIPSGK